MANLQSDTDIKTARDALADGSDILASLVQSEIGANDSEGAIAALLGLHQDMPSENALTAMRIAARTSIDIRKVHCTKTGQPIAERTESQLEQLIAFYGVDRLEKVIGNLDLASGIAPIWLHTGPENLNKLQEIDPKGFFCYCINVALHTHHRQYNKGGQRQFISSETERKYRNSLVQAWYSLSEISPEDLREANKHLRFYMYLNLHNRKYYKMPWHLMRAANEGQFKQLISLFEQGKKLRAVGKQGKAALMVAPSNDDKINADLETWVFDQDEKITKSIERDIENRVYVYDSALDPIMPHEFATERGITWIKACLARFLTEIRMKMQYNEVTYSHLKSTSSAFRRGDKLRDDILEYVDFGTFQSSSLLELKMRRNQIKGIKPSDGNRLTHEEIFDLDIKVVNGITTIDDGQLDLPIPAQAQRVKAEQPAKPTSTLKLNLSFLKK